MTIAADTSTPDRPEPEPSAWSLKSMLATVATFGPPLTIVTALMIYFGWARADAQSRVMGVDVSMFGYTTQDYVLRSISTLYLPLLFLSGLGLGWLAVHHQVKGRWLADARHRRVLRRAATWALVVGAAVALTALLLAWLRPQLWPLVAPVALAGGTAVAAYGHQVLRLAAEPSSSPARIGPSENALRALLVGVVVSLAVFWELSAYAGVVGRGYADRVADTVGSLPRVTITSGTPLGLVAPNVVEEPVTVAGPLSTDNVRYRTTGLRLLVNSGGRVFLLSEGWRPGAGELIVLPDNDSLDWQLSR